MNFIAQRPEHWVEVVGQERVLRNLSCILRNERFMPLGYLFKGPFGVGKTTTAYLFSRALMCTGNDPMGCGHCPSCQCIDSAEDIEKGLNLSIDFEEVDAASNSGVEHARNLIDIMNSPPSALSKRRVILVDEAHQLTSEAWDVYLKPLEAKETSSIYIFLSNRPEDIPGSIRNRLVHQLFTLVPSETIFGLLARLATDNGIAYENEGLQFIANRVKGIIREGVKILGVAGTMGTVTLSLAKDIMHDVLEDYCLKCYEALLRNNQMEAVQCIDEAGRNYSTSSVIEMMLSIYAKTPWAEPGTLYAHIFSHFPNVADIDAIFIKWLSNNNLPSDALPLVVYEIMNTVNTPATLSTRSNMNSRSPASFVSNKPLITGAVIEADDFERFVCG